MQILQELSTFFCFFAKVLQVPGQSQQWVRKCFVFNAHTEMTGQRRHWVAQSMFASSFQMSAMPFVLLFD